MQKNKKSIKGQFKSAGKRYQVFDGLLEGLQVVDFDWRFLYLNAAVLINFQKSKSQILGKTITEIYPGIEKTDFFGKLKSCMKQRIAYRLEHESVYPNKKKAWFEFSIQPSPEGIFILSLDITDRREAEQLVSSFAKRTKNRLATLIPVLKSVAAGNFAEELIIPKTQDEFTELFVSIKSMIGDLKTADRIKEEYIKKLEDLDKAKTEFLSIASHQLRTPVGSMRWSLEMLLHNEMGEISEEARETLKDIYESNCRLALLVKDLLTVSRIEQKKIKSEPVSTAINKILHEVARGMEPDARKKNVNLEVKIPDVLPNVMLDPERFREVMENLLSNAIKYTLEGGKVILKTFEKQNKITISVQDSGIGIPFQDKEKIFSKFFRASNVLRISSEGSGLGLYVARTYVEEWGGEIWFESAIDKGTVFYITIPV